MELRMIKKNGGLFPYDQTSNSYLSRIKTEDFLVVEAKKKRNPKFHRKYFAMLRMAVEQLDCTSDSLHDYIKDKTGRYDIVSIGGKVMKSYHSISFSKMDGIEFEIYYNESLQVICDLLGLDHAEIIEELEEAYF